MPKWVPHTNGEVIVILGVGSTGCYRLLGGVIVCLGVVAIAPISRGDDAVEWQIIRGGFKNVVDLAMLNDDNIWAASVDGLAHGDRHGWRLVVPDTLVTAVAFS